VSEPSALQGVRVSSMQVRGLCEAVEHAGHSAASFIARSGLDAAQMADPQAWFSLEVFDQLMVAAVQVTGKPSFGLHWGERSPMMQFDLAPILVATAPTLGAALDCLLRFQPILASRDEFRVSYHRDRCVLTTDVLGVTELGMRTRTELALSGLTRLLRYLGEGAAIRRINVSYARPAFGADYDALFGSLVHFDQPETSIEFARTALARTFAERNGELHQLMRDRTELLRQRVLGQLSYAQQLEQHIRAALPNLLSMKDAARALDISERSLRRRLALEDISYTDLVHRVQRKLADDLLALGTKSMKEIAHALGFGSVRGFHRAFRRWTGDTPAQARAPRARF